MVVESTIQESGNETFFKKKNAFGFFNNLTIS